MAIAMSLPRASFLASVFGVNISRNTHDEYLGIVVDCTSTGQELTVSTGSFAQSATQASTGVQHIPGL